MLPRWVRPDPRNSGAVSAVTFFYQMAALVVPDGHSVLYQKAANTLSYIGQVLSLQHPPPPGATDDGNTASYGSCVVHGIDARRSMLLALFSTLLLLLLLPVVMKGLIQLPPWCCKTRDVQLNLSIFLRKVAQYWLRMVGSQTMPTAA